MGYGEHPEEYRDLFDIESSSQAWEEDVEMSGFGLMPVKREGASTTYTGQTQGPISRYIHVAYSMGYIVTYEELKDNLYEKVSKSRAKALGFSKRQTKENVAANVYNRSETSGYTGGDGQVLCVTTHPSAVGSQSNILSTAADISEQCIEDMCIQIMGAVNYKGLKIALMPQSLHVHRNDWFEANRILKSTLQSGGANNDINALRSMSVIPDVYVNNYLTDADAWFIRTKAPNGMCWFDREPVQFSKDEDFDTDNAKAKAYMRFVPFWGDWRGLYSSSGA
jgi:hypothetical protein